jgi:hypothetical protein
LSVAGDGLPSVGPPSTAGHHVTVKVAARICYGMGVARLLSCALAALPLLSACARNELPELTGLSNGSGGLVASGTSGVGASSGSIGGLTTGGSVNTTGSGTTSGSSRGSTSGEATGNAPLGASCSSDSQCASSNPCGCVGVGCSGEIQCCLAPDSTTPCTDASQCCGPNIQQCEYDFLHDHLACCNWVNEPCSSDTDCCPDGNECYRGPASPDFPHTNVCKVVAGHAFCTSDGDCASDSCDISSMFCQKGRSSKSCVHDVDCASGICRPATWTCQ